MYQALEGRGISSFNLGRHRYLVSLWLAAVAVGTWRILRMENPRPWNRALNAASIAAVALPTLGLLGNVVQPQSVAVVPPPPIPAGADLPARSPLPDVYFVLLDMYARADILQILYDYDNRPFLDDLENMGLEVLNDSHSNYGQTSLSLAGTFQMRYLDEVFGTDRPHPAPIVILQGDHGSDASSVGTDPAPLSYVQERMSILNALLLPGCSRDGLKEDLTSVNTFRLILRNCFGQPMSLLEDRSFLSTYTDPYSWDEVTDQIH